MSVAGMGTTAAGTDAMTAIAETTSSGLTVGKSHVETSDGIQLAVRTFTGTTPGVAPDAPVRDLLLLHGWPMSGAVWETLAARLILAAPFRIVAPDLRGYGDSDRPDSGYTIAQFADDVNRVAGAVGLRQTSLIGHSMSGKTAQAVAAGTPPWLSSLVLLTPTPLSAPPSPPDAIQRIRDIQGDRDKTAALLAQLPAHPLSYPFQSLLLDEAMQVSPQAWHGWNEAMRGEDLDFASAITVSTLVLAGANDTTRPPDSVKTLVADRIAGSQYTVLPGVGHLPHLEEPTILAMQIVNFLDGLTVESA